LGKISHVKILFPEKRETNREVMVEKPQLITEIE